MLNKLKPKSEFTKNVLTLMTGTTIAQAIPIAISPILTRLYTPEDFGVFALYMSVASILSVVATGSYEHAIMLPKKDSDAINIVVLSILISFFVSFIVLLIVWIFNGKITSMLGNPNISNWLYFIPMSIFFTGIYQSFNYWFNRKKYYKSISATKIIQSSTSATTNLLLGLLKVGSGGLIIGNILGQVTALFTYIRSFFKYDFDSLNNINRLKIKILFKKYIDFFKYSNFSMILNSLSFNLLSMLLAKFFSVTILGYYNLVFRIMTLPSSLIGNSISQVYFEESTKQKNIYGNNKDIFKKTLKRLFLISSIIYLPMYFYIEDAFVFVFGKEWKISGEIAQILIPLMFIRFISSILSSTLTTYEKQKSGLFINFLLASTMVLVFIISKYLEFSYKQFFYSYTFTISILYFIFISYYYKLSKGVIR